MTPGFLRQSCVSITITFIISLHRYSMNVCVSRFVYNISW